MSSPVMAAMPSAGNLLAATSVAAAKNIGVFIDVSSVYEGQIDIRTTTGGTAASTSGVSVNFYHVYAQTTLSASVSASGTSLSVSSATGFAVGQLISVENEVVTVSAVSGTTLTVSAVIRAHSSSAAVYLISQTPFVVGPVIAQNLTAANTTYGVPLVLQTSTYYLSLSNLDAANAVTVEVTGRNWLTT